MMALKKKLLTAELSNLFFCLLLPLLVLTYYLAGIERNLANENLIFYPSALEIILSLTFTWYIDISKVTN